MKNAYSDSELFVLAADGGKYGSISRVGDVYVGREAAEAALKEIKEDAVKKNYTIGLES